MAKIIIGKWILLCSISLVFSFSSAQEAIIRFKPQPIGEALCAKPFFRPGFFIQVDNVSFENDTNYFTVYVVNNSAVPMPVSVTGQLETSDGNRKLEGLTMELIYSDLQEKIITELWDIIWGSHHYSTEDTLPTLHYLQKEMKIACPNCTQDNMRTVNLHLSVYKKYKYDKESHYFSDSFQVFYDQKAFYKLNFPADFFRAYPDMDYIPNGLSKTRWYSMNDPADSTLKIYAEGLLNKEISVSDLEIFPSKLLVYKNNVLTDSFKVNKVIFFFC